MIKISQRAEIMGETRFVVRDVRAKFGDGAGEHDCLRRGRAKTEKLVSRKWEGKGRERVAARRWLPRDELHRRADARSARTHTVSNDKSPRPTKRILGIPFILGKQLFEGDCIWHSPRDLARLGTLYRALMHATSARRDFRLFSPAYFSCGIYFGDILD